MSRGVVVSRSVATALDQLTRGLWSDKRLGQTARMLEMALNGYTYSDLGRLWSYGREYVRLCVTALWIYRTGRSAEDLHREMHKAREWRRTELEFVEQARHARPCVVCGYWVLRHSKWSIGHNDSRNDRGNRTCGPRCAAAWKDVGVRRFLSEEERRLHNLSQANLILRGRSRKYEEVWVRWAKGMIERDGLSDGTPSQRRRWHVEGSHTTKLLRELGLLKEVSDGDA